MSESHTMSRAELAKLLRVSAPTISNAVTAGAPVKDPGSKGRPAKYDAPEFLAWWIENERRKAREAATGDKRAAAGEELDNEIKREKLAQLRKEYVPRVAFVDVMRDAYTRLRVAMDRGPSRYAAKFVGTFDELTARERLTEIFRELRGELREPKQWLPPENSEDLAA